MNEIRPLLSIIMVNYRSGKWIADSIQSLLHLNPGLACEIIIVDNDASAGEKTELLQKFPSLRYFEMKQNSGFARANNQGMRLASGNVFLLLNPDTLSIDNSIKQCYERLQTDRFVAAGVQQLNADHTPQISGNFFVKGGLNHLLPIPYWGDFIRWMGYRTQQKVPNIPEATTTVNVDWISGAFLMVKRSAVEDAGMMDEDFFLYAEEVEWCSRLKREGDLCIYGDLHIIHLEGAAINSDRKIEEKGYYNLYDKKGLQLMVSNHLRVRKQYGVVWFIFLLLNYSWGFFVFLAASTLHRLFTLRNPFGDWSRVFAFGGNLMRLWSLAPTIIRGKPHFYKMF
jgi:GT2 family glycosyltransferase